MKKRLWHIYLKGNPSADIYIYSTATNLSDVIEESLEPMAERILNGTEIHGLIEEDEQ